MKKKSYRRIENIISDLRDGDRVCLVDGNNRTTGKITGFEMTKFGVGRPVMTTSIGKKIFIFTKKNIFKIR